MNRAVLEAICEDMCSNYCKWPVMYRAEEHDGIELIDSGICDKCPLDRLEENDEKA